LKFLETLKQPFPCRELERTIGQNMMYSLLIGAFVSLFLIVFQPFGLSNWHTDQKWMYLVGFGLITFFMLLFTQIGLTRLLPAFYNEDGWTVGKEIIHNLVVMGLITVGNFLFAIKIGIYSWSLLAFLVSFIFVLAIGVFPISFNVLLKFKSSNKRFDKGVEVSGISRELVSEITLKSENQNEDLTLMSDNLLYLESNDNYSNVYFAEGDIIKNQLLRGSLSYFEKQMEPSHITRCHRSYIVNLDKAQEITGNAQGYKVHLEGVEKKIPVSRKYSHILENLK
jgi:hypothetical protein